MVAHEFETLELGQSVALLTQQVRWNENSSRDRDGNRKDQGGPHRLITPPSNPVRHGGEMCEFITTCDIGCVSPR